MGGSPEGCILLTPSMIPDSPSFDVKDSAFFKNRRRLPSPAEVRDQAETQHLAGINPDKRRTYSVGGPNAHPPPVVFEDLGILVKWGLSVNIPEAQSLYAVRKALGNAFPVPEVYGWRTNGAEKFLYMEYVQGKTLEQVWGTMKLVDRANIRRQLRAIVVNLRRLGQDPLDSFIGTVTRTRPLYDRVFHIEYMSEAGPFATVGDFHNWFTFLHRRRWMPDPYSVPIEPYRDGLPDSSTIKFTHGDLHRTNIIVTPSQPFRVLALVDWEQSGWFPEYWEARKAKFTADRTGKWSTKFLPMILDQYESTWEPWGYYMMSMGC